MAEETFGLIFILAVTPNYVEQAGTLSKKKKKQEITAAFSTSFNQSSLIPRYEIGNANYFSYRSLQPLISTNKGHQGWEPIKGGGTNWANQTHSACRS